MTKTQKIPKSHDFFVQQPRQDRNNKLEERKYLQFNCLLLVSAVFPIILVAIFNYVIDPYDIFNTPNILGLNHSKPRQDNNDRLFKAIAIVRLQPRTILTGSSRSKQGLNPDHPALATDGPVYNLSLNGVTAYEVRRYLEHAIINNPEGIKQVIIGIDFFMFNYYRKPSPSFLEKRLEKENIIAEDAINALFSIDTFWGSKDTIISSLQESNLDDDYGENGFMPNRNANDGKTKWRFEHSINEYFMLNPDYQLSGQYLEDFKTLVEICQKNDIKLQVFISPSHALQWETIRATGHWQTFENWKREIVKIMPVWDFSGYNSVTTEQVANTMKNYYDSSHYSEEVGNLIFNKILSYEDHSVPQDFGKLIDRTNIEQNLERIRANREIWARKNVAELQLLREVKEKYDLSTKKGDM